MKIAIVGSYSVGKTTLYQNLKKIFSDKIQFIDEIPRKVLVENNYDITSFTVEDRMKFQQDCITRQIKTENKYDSFVVDTGLNGYVPFLIGLPNEEQLTSQVNNYLQDNKYDLVLYIPIEFDMEVDGFRVQDDTFRRFVSIKNLEILKDQNYNYHVISGTKEERFDKATKILKDTLAKMKSPTKSVA